MTLETEERAPWSSAYVDALPDSAFADPANRRYPHHDASGAVDRAHLANAMARCNQDATTCSTATHAHLMAHEKTIGMGAASGEPDGEIRHGPRDDLYRAMPGGVLSEDGKTLTVRLAPHDQWAEIDSKTEGHFMERFAKSAYRKTMADHKPKILFQHGKDPEVGEKPIATTDEVGEDAISPFARGQILDGVPELIRSGLRAKPPVYGASHRFSVVREDWVDRPLGGLHNPNKLPERTITEAHLHELGPVTWPAYAGASVALRSLTDEFTSITEPVAPSVDAEAEPHLESERRDEPDPPPEAAVIAAQDPPDGGSSDSRSAARVDKEYETPAGREARITELKEVIARQAVAFPGELPTDEQARYDADNDELNALLRAKAAWESRQARLVELSVDERHTDKPRDTSGRPYEVKRVNQINQRSEAEIYSFDENGFRNVEERDQTWRDDAMRITERMSFPHPATDVERSKDRVAWLLDNHDSKDKEFARRVKATDSPVYKRAFNKIIQYGGTQFLTPEEMRGTALAVGVDGTGGFAIPVAFDLTVIAIGVHGGAINPYRRVCRVVPLVGTDTWNALTATAVTATRTTEAAPAIEQGPTFAQPQYIVKRVQAQITYSLETGQDRPDISSEMAKLIGEAKDNEEETSFAIGNGSAPAALGIGPVSGTSGAYTAVPTATSAVIAAADADATESALPVRHRFNAQWFLSRTAIRKFQSVETTGGKLFGAYGAGYPAVGNPNAEATGNTGLRILGYPVNESPSLPVATTTTITIGTLLNPDSYVIVERIGMSIQIIPFIFGASQGNLVTGQQALYAMWRNTAAPINVDAGRTLRFV